MFFHRKKFVIEPSENYHLHDHTRFMLLGEYENLWTHHSLLRRKYHNDEELTSSEYIDLFGLDKFMELASTIEPEPGRKIPVTKEMIKEAECHITPDKVSVIELGYSIERSGWLFSQELVVWHPDAEKKNDDRNITFSANSHIGPRVGNREGQVTERHEITHFYKKVLSDLRVDINHQKTAKLASKY